MSKHKIYLHHYPDPTKSRGSYLGLLKLRAEESPDDLYGLYYLAREYNFHNEYQNALKAALELYIRLLKGNPTKEELSVRDDMNMLPGTCCMLGDMFWKCGLKDDAEFYYGRAIHHNHTMRDGYIKLAQLLAYSGRSEECYAVLRDMNNETIKTTDWRSVDYYWRDWSFTVRSRYVLYDGLAGKVVCARNPCRNYRYWNCSHCLSGLQQNA